MPRMVFALARDGFLPRALAAVAPSSSLAAGGHRRAVGITLAFALTGTFERLAILANVSALALYFGCALASWQLRRPGVTGGGIPFRVPFAGVVPWLACAVIVWLLTGLTRSEWLAFAACVALASLPYALTRRRATGCASL